MTFTFHADPGHGWLEVPITLINELKIGNKISHYSFVNRNMGVAYLEEDCDAALFINAMEAANKPLKFEEVYHNERFAGTRCPRWET